MAIETIDVDPGTGANKKAVAADLISGTTYYQVIKLAFGSDGSVTIIDGSNPLPTQISDGTETANVNVSNQLEVAEANSAAIKTAVEIIDDWDESDRAKANIIVGQAGAAAGEGVPGVAVIRTVEAVNQADFSGDGTPPIDSVSAITNSSVIDCTNKKKIILHTEYSDSGGTAPIVVILMDHNGTTQAESWVGPATPANSGVSLNPIETSYYQGETIVVDVNGAKEFKIRVNAAPSAGNVSVFAAVV
jgi:hypothetical protein